VVLLDVSTAVIWVAFTTEFIVMASTAEEKFAYCRQHWLDLAIILLPLISFARALRVARAARLGRLGSMSRLYRLRGLAMRAFRAVLLLDIVKRLLLIRPEKRLARLQRALAAKERELAQLRCEIAELNAIVASRQRNTPQPPPVPLTAGAPPAGAAR
jgi:voltage-gated potassium channel